MSGASLWAARLCLRASLWLLAFTLLASACARNIKTVRNAYSREMGCPSEKIIVMQMPPGHPQRGESWQVYGCEQRRICFDDNQRGVWACRWSDDLQAAAARLKLETNCPTESTTPTAYIEQGRSPSMDDDGADWAWQGGAYRIDACGKHFVCTVAVSGGATCAAAPDLASGLLPTSTTRPR